MYVLNFILHTMLYLPFYALQKKRYDVALGMLACFGVYFSVFPLMHATVPYFFYTTFGVSFVLGPFALMLGNYSQHIFVDPANPQSNYGLACNHVNAPFNMLTFNDGYHITHHVSSITHWSEMPLHFIRHLDAYEAGGAIIFRELTFDDITFNVFAGEKVHRRTIHGHHAHRHTATPPHRTAHPSQRTAAHPRRPQTAPVSPTRSSRALHCACRASTASQRRSCRSCPRTSS